MIVCQLSLKPVRMNICRPPQLEVVSNTAISTQVWQSISAVYKHPQQQLAAFLTLFGNYLADLPQSTPTIVFGDFLLSRSSSSRVLQLKCHLEDSPSQYKDPLQSDHELTMYVRTDLKRSHDYAALLAIGYPDELVPKTEDKARILNTDKPPPLKFYPPIYKCIPPPQYKIPKSIVLRNFSYPQNIVPAPRFTPRSQIHKEGNQRKTMYQPGIAHNSPSQRPMNLIQSFTRWSCLLLHAERNHLRQA